MPDFFIELNKEWIEILQNPAKALAIIGNLIIIESLLSVDNAAVLATMVMDLPEKRRNQALKYGIWGAYIFRGLALVFASILMSIWWLKPLGGLYLIWLFFSWYRGKKTKEKDDDLIENAEHTWFYKITKGWLGGFWATVVSIEIMDLAFSIDNVLAAVAFSNNLLLVSLGVFIGILAMRFVAGWFVKLMEKFPFLEASAFIVILILGIKLLLSLFDHFYPNSEISKFLNSHSVDVGLTVITLLIFALPILTSILINKKNKH